MNPMWDPFIMAKLRTALCFFVFMVRKDQVDSSRMNVKMLPEEVAEKNKIIDILY